MRSKLPNSVLRRVWNLSDIDQDGMLDRDEFAVAMFLVNHKLSGNDIPEMLPDRLVPPSKVQRYRVQSHGGAQEGERRGRYGDREEPSMHSGEYSVGGNSTSYDASYARDSGYGRDASNRGESRKGGGGGGREGGYEEGGSYGGGGYSSLRGRQTDDYDDDSAQLSSFIDKGQ